MIDGNDTSKIITIKTGTTGLSLGEILIINFAKPYSKQPKIMLTAGNNDIANLKYYRENTIQNTKILLTQPTVPNTTYLFDYFVIK